MRFGPFYGIFDDLINHGSKKVFQPKAERNGKEIMVPNGGEMKEACWIQYINFACSQEKQNVIAVHTKSEVYYITCKDISANQQLLIWCHVYHIEKTEGSDLCGGTNAETADLMKLDDHNRDRNVEILNNAKGGFYQNILRKKGAAKKINFQRKDSCPTKNQTPVALDSLKSGHSVIHAIRTSSNKQRFIKEKSAGSGGDNKQNEVKSDELEEISEIKSEAHLNESNDSKDKLLHFRKIIFSGNECHYNSHSVNKEKEKIDLLQSSQSQSTTGKSSSIQTSRLSYNCRFCGKQFTAKKGLILHEKVHTGRISYSCKICGKKFNANSKLNVHRRIHTGDRPYHCSICGKKFTTNSNLNVHKRIHTGDRPYQCNICRRNFNQSSHLNTHKSTHTGDRPFQCNICGKKFKTNRHLSVHKKIHTGDRLYQCNICEKKFRMCSQLKIHERRHGADRPFQCDICAKKFKTSTELNVHNRRHTGDRPYQCIICGKKFTTNSNLNVHKRLHTGDELYQCIICRKKFITKNQLNVHERTHR